MPRRRPRACLAVATGVLVAAGLVGPLSAGAASADEPPAEQPQPLVPNASLGVDAAGWSTGSNARVTWASVDHQPIDVHDAQTDPLPAGGVLRLQARKSSTQTVVASSATSGRVVPAGTVVRVAAPIQASRTLRVTFTLREVSPTGKTVQSVSHTRSVGSGWRFASTTVTTKKADSRLRVLVQTRASKRPVVSLGGVDVFEGSQPFAGEEVLLPSPARTWVRDHDSLLETKRERIASRIASQPTAVWLTSNDTGLSVPLEAAVTKAEHLNGSATIVLYYRPKRWDGISGFEGAKDLTEYKKYVDRVADRIGSARITVVVEPDGLWFNEQAQLLHDSGKKSEDAQLNYSAKDLKMQLDAIKYAASKLSALPATRVLIEAGTSSGSLTPEQMADALKRAGASNKVGYVVNVSSYAPEPSITQWADDIRAALKKLKVSNPLYAVDTGRNGDPDWTGRETADEPRPWCNWPDARLGADPGPATTEQRTHGRVLNLWVKGPGESDGNCRGDDPDGGEFMPDYAYSMAQ